MSENKCFIVMPITTPQDYIDLYAGDKDHFKHVLEHLFIPAIENIGLKPVTPVTKGSEIIHAEIIKNIENSEYVLCDMSILNPNVFFELGIRTAVNKPIALVKDDATPKVPFDTNIINNHTYLNSLAPWTLDSEVKKLSQHLENCFKNEEKDNSLWKYFSLSAKAKPLDEKTKDEDKLGYLSLQMDALRKEIVKNNLNEGRRYKTKNEEKEDRLFHALVNIASSEGVTINSGSWGRGKMSIDTEEPVTKDLENKLLGLAELYEIHLSIEHKKEKS